MIERCREGVKKAIDFDEVAQGLNKRIIIQQAVFQVSFCEEFLFHIGLHWISGIRPDIWYRLPDIRIEKLF